MSLPRVPAVASVALVALATMLSSGDAHGQPTTPEKREPTTREEDEPPRTWFTPPPPAPAPPTPQPPSSPPTHPIPKHPEPLPPPPSGVVPVPTPSPVVIGGKPTAPGIVVPPLEWRRTRFSTADFIITLAGGALTLTAAIAQPSPKHVRGPVLFDEAARDLLSASTVQARYGFRDASDIGLSLIVTWPFFVDSLITAWWLRGSRDTAEQMALLGLETLAVSGAIQGLTNMFVSRERPYGATCGAPMPEEEALPREAIDCSGSSHYRSFFSGHSSFSFTSAALICFEHVELELLGGPWDAISCGTAYGVAATTATLRIVGDMHYASDVLTGALIGSLVGYGVPLLHFKHPEIATVKTNGMTIRAVPTGLGAGVVGQF